MRSKGEQLNAGKQLCLPCGGTISIKDSTGVHTLDQIKIGWYMCTKGLCESIYKCNRHYTGVILYAVDIPVTKNGNTYTGLPLLFL